MNSTIKNYFGILIWSIIIVIFSHRWSNKLNQTHTRQDRNYIPTIIWWSSAYFLKNGVKVCGNHKCYFTSNRNVLNNSDTKGIMFYGTDMGIDDFPLPRLKHHQWALLHEESPKNLPYILHENVLKYFNYTATFSRYSNCPLTLQAVEYDALRSKRHVIPITIKTKLRKFLAPIAYLQSICDTLSGRDEYITELMKFIPIDSYGSCLNNRKLPKSLSGSKYLETIDSEKLYKFLARYKFIIAYENAVCDDYITEKIWRPLTIGSIPIYYGSPTIKDWLPNKKSAILISDFDSPEDLANFIKHLDKDDIEYNTYLDHKYKIIEPISNSFLKDKLFGRMIEKYSVFEDFECYFCKHIHNTKNNQDIHATQNHYDCANESTYSKTNKKINSNEWHSLLVKGECDAEILDILFTENRNYTSRDFRKLLGYHIFNGNCKNMLNYF